MTEQEYITIQQSQETIALLAQYFSLMLVLNDEVTHQRCIKVAKRAIEQVIDVITILEKGNV